MDSVTRVTKLTKVGGSFYLVIPASVVRALKLSRGDYFDLVMSDRNTMVAQRLKMRTEGAFGEEPDKSLPVIKHG